MIVFTEEVGVSWDDALQVNNVGSLVGTSDAFDFGTACNLNLVA
jgi:hypothetical protein